MMWRIGAIVGATTAGLAVALLIAMGAAPAKAIPRGDGPVPSSATAPDDDPDGPGSGMMPGGIQASEIDSGEHAVMHAAITATHARMHTGDGGPAVDGCHEAHYGTMMPDTDMHNGTMMPHTDMHNGTMMPHTDMHNGTMMPGTDGM